MPPLLGCIADDFTGATDLASALVRSGMRVAQWFGVPTSDFSAAVQCVEADAIVIALKSRSIPAAEAVKQSLDSLDALRSVGAKRYFFKYCSTFDSTDQGNIGPVAEALLVALGTDITVFCPALPENGRTLYQGHLFVHGRLLSESGMESHPLNPMFDSDVVRVLSRQVTRPVGLIRYETLQRGAASINMALADFRGRGISLVVIDSLDDGHLRDVATAIADLPLTTGGSGIARALALAYRRRGEIPERPATTEPLRVAGSAAVVAGSRSATTQRQLKAFAGRFPTVSLDVGAVLRGEPILAPTIRLARQHLENGPVAIQTSGELVGSVKDDPRQAAIIEESLAEIASCLVASGVRRLVVAGGETSGAIVQKLGVKAVRISSLIEPGVPWIETIAEPRLALALKSGNFGSDDFFLKALEVEQ